MSSENINLEFSLTGFRYPVDRTFKRRQAKNYVEEQQHLQEKQISTEH